MLRHTEAGVSFDTDIAPGQHSQVLFDDELAIPLNGQREVSFVTFWPTDALDDVSSLPIWLQIHAVTRDAPILYRSTLDTALSVAIPIAHTRIRLVIWWKSDDASRGASHVRFDMRIEVDVRRRPSSFSHINRHPELPDPHTLPPGKAQIVPKI